MTRVKSGGCFCSNRCTERTPARSRSSSPERASARSRSEQVWENRSHGSVRVEQLLGRLQRTIRSSAASSATGNQIQQGERALRCNVAMLPHLQGDALVAELLARTRTRRHEFSRFSSIRECAHTERLDAPAFSGMLLIAVTVPLCAFHPQISSMQSSARPHARTRARAHALTHTHTQSRMHTCMHARTHGRGRARVHTNALLTECGVHVEWDGQHIFAPMPRSVRRSHSAA